MKIDSRPAEVNAVTVFQKRYQLGKVHLLINAYQQVIGVDEIPQPLAGELEQLRASASSSTTECPGIVAQNPIDAASTPIFSTRPLIVLITILNSMMRTGERWDTTIATS